MASDLQGATLSINGRAYRPLMASYRADLWAAQNPILQRGEIGIEQDTDKFKIGNGIDRWNTLPYSSGPKGDKGDKGDTGDTGPQGPYFTPSVALNGDISWTNNGGLPNPETVNIKGPQGIQGEQGPQGLVINNIVVADLTGAVTVTTSSSISVAPTAKALIGGTTISGTWTQNTGQNWTFTPTDRDDILSESWIITLPSA